MFANLSAETASSAIFTVLIALLAIVKAPPDAIVASPDTADS